MKRPNYPPWCYADEEIKGWKLVLLYAENLLFMPLFLWKWFQWWLVQKKIERLQRKLED